MVWLQGVRDEDWRIADPVGAPIEEIGRGRGDIEYRVRGLLTQLGWLGRRPWRSRAIREANAG